MSLRFFISLSLATFLMQSCGKSTESDPQVVDLNSSHPIRVVTLERDEFYATGQVNLLTLTEDFKDYNYSQNFYASISDLVVKCHHNDLFIMERFMRDSLAKFVFKNNSISKKPIWQISTYSAIEDGPTGEKISSSNPLDVISIDETHSLLLRYESRVMWMLDTQATKGADVRIGKVDLLSLFPDLISPNSLDTDGTPEISSAYLYNHKLYIILSHLDRLQRPWEVNQRADLIVLDVKNNYAPVSYQTLPFKNVTSEIQRHGKYLYVAGVDKMMDAPGTESLDAGLIRFNLETLEVEQLISEMKISNFALVYPWLVFVKYSFGNDPQIFKYHIPSMELSFFKDEGAWGNDVEVMKAGPQQTLWFGHGGLKNSWSLFQLGENDSFELINSFSSSLIPAGLAFCD